MRYRGGEARRVEGGGVGRWRRRLRSSRELAWGLDLSSWRSVARGRRARGGDVELGQFLVYAPLPSTTRILF